MAPFPFCKAVAAARAVQPLTDSIVQWARSARNPRSDQIVKPDRVSAGLFRGMARAPNQERRGTDTVTAPARIRIRTRARCPRCSEHAGAEGNVGGDARTTVIG